jgi:hypothetical protein
MGEHGIVGPRAAIDELVHRSVYVTKLRYVCSTLSARLCPEQTFQTKGAGTPTVPAPQFTRKFVHEFNQSWARRENAFYRAWFPTRSDRRSD